jgi:hypothetical protein
MHRLLLHILFAFPLLVASCGQQREHMFSILAEAEHHNQNYQSMAGDTLVAEAADYMERYGTPNEQLRAYYLLGSYPILSWLGVLSSYTTKIRKVCNE